jgi:hypothetical protein
MMRLHLFGDELSRDEFSGDELSWGQILLGLGNDCDDVANYPGMNSLEDKLSGGGGGEFSGDELS